MIAKFIEFIKGHYSEILLVTGIILISIFSYNLGQISAYKNARTPITITEPENVVRRIAGEGKKGETVLEQKQGETKGGLTVIASKKSSSKVYHFTWCPGASMIAEKNKLVFPDEAAALAAGYTLAGNCKK